MERLPDRPSTLQDTHSEMNANANKTKKQSRKEKASTYSLLILIIVCLFIIMQKSEVSLDDITVTDCSANDAGTSLFVAGTLGDGERFAGSQVDFNEETGIAEITLYQYTTPTFFGTEDFVAMIDTSKADVKEIWLKNENDKLQVK